MGKRYVVEPIIENRPAKWGDVDPATGKLSGSYGEKHQGAVRPDQSVVTPENGYENVVVLEPGQSPIKYIMSKQDA